MPDHVHRYPLGLTWEDASSEGTIDYRTYGRRFRVTIAGKPDLVGSADAAFRGDPALANPEDLLVASIASCHMLSYLALCARHGVRVTDYRDEADGRMVTDAAGGGRFEEVALRPRVTIAADGDAALAHDLHSRAHAACFIASSCNFPITCEPTVVRAPARHDLAIRLPDRPGALAELGEVLGRAGLSLEGGGGFVVGAAGIAHFLVADAAAASAALADAGIELIAIGEVVSVRLDQDTPGQLGAIARAMADAGVNIACVYSDHAGELILGVDDVVAGRRVAKAWRRRAS